MDSAAIPPFGSMIDEYRIDAVLSRGGMGIVYTTENTTLERTVALKIISLELAQDEMFLKRSSREARALAKISPPTLPVAPGFTIPGPPGRPGSN